VIAAFSASQSEENIRGTKRKEKMKKIIVLIVASLVIAAINFWTWQLTEKIDLQLAWVAFSLVWVNLILSWITERRQRAISYLLLSSSLIIEAILLVNYFWMQKGSRFL